MSETEKKSLIWTIYNLDWIEPTKEEQEAGEEWLDKFFKEEKIDRNSKLGANICNLAYDYMTENLRYAFRNGFITGVRLMTEVFAHE